MQWTNQQRRGLWSVVAIALIASGCQGAAAPSATPTVTPTPTPAEPVAITARELAVRAGPDSTYPIVAHIQADAALQVYAVSEDGAWALISPPGAEGRWLALSPFVAVYGDLGGITALTITAAPTQPPQVIPQRELLVRAGPGLDYAIVGTAAADEALQIYAISDDGGWALISPLGQEGRWLGLSPLAELRGDLSSVGIWGATPVPATPTLPPLATPTAAPTLDMQVVVGTVQVAVVETLVAQAAEAQIAQATAAAAQEATAVALQNMPVDVSVDDDPAIGPEDAPVVIVEFSDFTCPYCGRFARETLADLLAAYPDQVRFVYRDAPILGPVSVQAALAAECADDQGRFWEYHDLLFENQGSLSYDTFLSLAATLDLSMEDFTPCLDERIHLEEITNDYNASQEAGLTGTPTFFINGRRLVGAQPLEAFVQMIEEELAQQN